MSTAFTVSRWQAWLLATRPKTLFASVCPVTIGAAWAARHDVFHAGSVLAALIGALAIQIGTNFTNDYFDHRQGADTHDRKGPTRAVQAGWVRPGEMLAAGLLMFFVMALTCVYMTIRAGWPVLAIGAISAGCGIWYTASRYSLAYLGLGDLFVLVFFGPVAVGGTYFVQAGRWDVHALIAGIAPGLISVAILVVNNLRDIHEDAAANKRTLAVRLGERFARGEYWACMIGAACIPLLLWSVGALNAAALLASSAVLPGWQLAWDIGWYKGRELNPFLGKTGAVLLHYSVMFSVVSVWT